MSEQYTEKIAKIERVSLGYEDHGIFTCMLHLDFGGSGQGAGGYALDAFDEESGQRRGTAYGMEWIIRVMRACGVDEWSDVKGKTVLCLYEPDGYFPVGIKPLPTERGEQFIFDQIKELASA